MKKYLLTTFLLILPFMASGETININGIWYNIFPYDKIAEVTYNPSKSPDYSGDITIPEQIKYNSIVYPVTKIGDAAFAYCTNLTSVIIPRSVISIGWWAFYDCSRSLFSIKVDSNNPQYDSRNSCNAIIETSSNTLITGCMNTNIPNSVTSIGRRAFYGCSGLTSITIPNSVTTIDQWAFYNCTGLTSITIPNSMTSIGYSVFYCSGLTSITIPNSVSSIEAYAFSLCWNLRDIYCWAEKVPNTDDSTFESSLYIYATIHVPAVSVDAYKQTYPWNKFLNIVPLTDDDPKPTDILSLKTNDNINSVEIYTIDGKRKSQPQRGLNIIRMSNGTTKKVIK